MAGVKPGGHALSQEQAKQRVLKRLAAGDTVEKAMKSVSRSVKTWESWKRSDPDFKVRADTTLATRKVDSSTRETKRADARAMGFAAWRKKYLDMPTYLHQQQWIDLIEGREPRALHESQVFERGRRNWMIINCPPFHAKSMTITIDYLTYRICCDPTIRTIIVSKTQGLAKQFLGAIKMRLTHPKYADLIRDFAPEGGFEETAEQWASDMVTLSTDDRDGVEKDPTIQALGIRGQIYGARADLIIVDDAVTLANANEWEAQQDWLIQEVGSRPGPSGKIIVVGTRVRAGDLYYQLRNGENYTSGKSPWTYLSQPAILEEHPDPNQWKTLWPSASISWTSGQAEVGEDECDCGQDICRAGWEVEGEGGKPAREFPRWDGIHLNTLRDSTDNRRWQLVFMQAEVGGDATFPAYAIQDSINRGRRRGSAGGMMAVPEGCYIIGSLDPATSGNAGALVMAVHRSSHKRYILDVKNLKHPTPRELKNLMKAWTVEYGIHEWRVEKTGLLTMFTQDDELRSWMNARGVRFTEHYTGKGKWDVEFGVASLAPLFGSYQEYDDGTRARLTEPLIELPRIETDDLKTFVHQLTIWTPELDPKRTPCDLVMALWFADIGARQIARQGDRSPIRRMSSLAPHRDKSRAAVYDLSQYRKNAVA
jgi:hypothetical protein